MPKPLPADTWNNLFYPPPDYQYFQNADRFDFDPRASGFSWQNAWWLADTALLAYVKSWDSVCAALTAARFEEPRPIGSDPAKSTKGFFASRAAPAPFAIVAFRGTDKDDPRNAATDENTLPLSRDGHTVHAGFAAAFDQVWESEVAPMLAGFLAQRPAAPVFFTGHSLGAALATIAVTRFTGDASSLYTIGSPRVGDDRFVRSVLQKTSRVFRFVNCQDIVTQIPPEVPLKHYFRHAGLEKYIDRHGVIHDHPTGFDKGIDVAEGIIAHDGRSALTAIGHPQEFFAKAKRQVPLVDPPPYVIGNHTAARYAIRIWNFYSGL